MDARHTVGLAEWSGHMSKACPRKNLQPPPCPTTTTMTKTATSSTAVAAVVTAASSEKVPDEEWTVVKGKKNMPSPQKGGVQSPDQERPKEVQLK